MFYSFILNRSTQNVAVAVAVAAAVAAARRVRLGYQLRSYVPSQSDHKLV